MTRASTLALLITLPGLGTQLDAGPGVSEGAAQLYIGASETSITPDQPVALEGSFRLRISQGVRTPIMASAVVVESREGDRVVERSIMVSADLVHLPMELIYLVREMVAKELPEVDVNKIFISVTHTHAAPVVMPDNFVIPPGVMSVEDYGKFFARQVADAIVKALGTMQPGSVAWGLGSAQVAYNRRTCYLDGRGQMYGPTRTPNYKGPEGPEYQGIPTLFFFDAEEKPLAVAVNVWCPAQEEGGSPQISADFWHPVRVRLKETLGPQLQVLAWCGPSGDQSPARRLHADAEDRMRRLRGVDSWVDEFGRRIADSVTDTYNLVKHDRHDDVRLVHRTETLRLPGWKFTDDQLARIRTEHDQFTKDLAAHPEKTPTLARPISWRAQTLQRHRQISESSDGCLPSEIHVVRIGDVAICTNQFELFTEFGLRMLARSNSHLTFAVQLTGPAHYLPTAEAVQGGGYSAVPESCAVGPEGGNVLVDKTVEHINAIMNDLKVTLPEQGQLKDGKLVGDGWVNLIGTIEQWHAEPQYWKLSGCMLHGESTGGEHRYAWTKKKYTDFELHAVLRMRGGGANSGVCIRMRPVNASNAPGYQVDMGSGFWGSLWEEDGDGMVQQYPQKRAEQLVRANDWNHYYIVAKGHHIQAWLNGVQTIDVVHKKGFPDGAIGLELCHGQKHTILDVKMLVVRETE